MSETGDSLYPFFSLINQSRLASLSSDTLKTIGKLDESTERLSQILDSKCKELYDKGDDATAEEKEEVETLLKVLDMLSNNKASLAVQCYDYIDTQIKSVDTEMSLIEKALRREGIEAASLEHSEANGDRRAKRKCTDSQGEAFTTQANTTTGQATAEPVYCSCKRIAFGEMIACDNEDCPIEWFHYPCVNLTRKPRNSWICPVCSTRRKK
ncbi:hypothetical protein EON65_48905 [archaeon]|nr:MAG: hypothetical protein EON65_48905 [archaeon]